MKRYGLTLMAAAAMAFAGCGGANETGERTYDDSAYETEGADGLRAQGSQEILGEVVRVDDDVLVLRSDEGESMTFRVADVNVPNDIQPGTRASVQYGEDQVEQSGRPGEVLYVATLVVPESGAYLQNQAQDGQAYGTDLDRQTATRRDRAYDGSGYATGQATGQANRQQDGAYGQADRQAMSGDAAQNERGYGARMSDQAQRNTHDDQAQADRYDDQTVAQDQRDGRYDGSQLPATADHLPAAALAGLLALGAAGGLWVVTRRWS